MPPPGGAITALATHPVDAILMSVNSNPYFIGLMMLMLNLGGRFVSMEMSKSQELFFQNVWVRRLLIFTILFVGTRNVAVAFWMSIIIILCLGYLFNENSSLCLFTGNDCKPDGQMGAGTPAPVIGMPSMPSMPSAAPSMPGLSPEEATIYKTLHDKQTRTIQKEQENQQKYEEKKKKKSKETTAQTYIQNMMMLRSDGFANPRF
jgi:hypothetical protein